MSPTQARTADGPVTVRLRRAISEALRDPRRILLLGLVAVQSVAVLLDLATQHNRMVLNAISPSSITSGVLMVLAAVVLWWRRRRPTTPVPTPSQVAKDTPATTIPV